MTTLERLQQILLAHYPVPAESLTPDARLEQFDIDSLGMMELFFAIEDEFDVRVPNEQHAMQTVGDLVDYIDELLDKPGEELQSTRDISRAANKHDNVALDPQRTAS